MLNKVHLIGNLGEAPELRALPSGTAVATFSLATSEQWKDKTTGEKKTSTEWHTVECFAKLAEVVDEHTYKGMRVWVEGKIHYDEWDDKETGEKKYRTKIIASRILFLSRKEQKDEQVHSNTNKNPETDLQFPDPAPADAPSPNRAAWEKEKNRVAAKVPVKKKTPPAPFIDDEIPF